MSEALLLHGIRVVDPASRRNRTAGVAIADGKVSVIGARPSAVAARAGNRPGRAGSTKQLASRHARKQ
jgi:predicted amidohydrolase